MFMDMHLPPLQTLPHPKDMIIHIAKIKTMLKKKSLTVIGDNVECPKLKGCLPVTCPRPDQLCLLGPLALKLCLLACWEDNTGMTKFAWTADYKRFYLHLLY